MVRVSCVAVDEDEWDDLQLQLLLDDQDKIIPKISMLGVFGTWQRRRDTNWPFIYQLALSGEDELDFGTFPEILEDSEFDVFDPARFGRTNLHGKAIKRGELITIWVHDDEICYRIKAVETLIEGELGKAFAEHL